MYVEDLEIILGLSMQKIQIMFMYYFMCQILKNYIVKVKIYIVRFYVIELKRYNLLMSGICGVILFNC